MLVQQMNGNDNFQVYIRTEKSFNTMEKYFHLTASVGNRHDAFLSQLWCIYIDVDAANVHGNDATIQYSKGKMKI